jgi:hypothetical protein
VKRRSLILIVLRTKQCVKVSQSRNLLYVSGCDWLHTYVIVHLPSNSARSDYSVNSIKAASKKLPVWARTKESF